MISLNKIESIYKRMIESENDDSAVYAIMLAALVPSMIEYIKELENKVNNNDK